MESSSSSPLIPKLPREIESDPRRDDVFKILSKNMRPIWEKGTILVSHVDYTSKFENALNEARRDSSLVRGLEKIETLLKAEQKGLAEVHAKKGTTSGNRVSRLLIFPEECPERFYRKCESLLFQHSDRLLGIRMNIPFSKFAQKLFGEEALVKALLISDRKSVANVLFSLLGPL